MSSTSPAPHTGTFPKSPSSVNLTAVQEQAENPTPQLLLPPPDAIAGTRGDKFAIVMVGLPARGKTFIARRLSQYLKFFHGALCKVFNVGNYRREKFGPSCSADYFDPANVEASKQRQQCSQAAMNDMKDWIAAHEGTGTVAVFDATNTTKQKRVRWSTLFLLLLELYLLFQDVLCIAHILQLP